MNKILFYCPDLQNGHCLEYFRCFYTLALNNKENHYYFCTSEESKVFQTENFFVDSENITIKFLRRSHVLNKFEINKELRTLTRLYNVTDVFLISFDMFFPYFPLFVNRKVRYHGIFYYIYLYKFQKCTLKEKLKLFKYPILMCLMSKMQPVTNMFICNDNSSASYFNRLFHCDKFSSIVDPYNTYCEKKDYNFRQQYKIGETVKIISHFGVLSSRKGTLNLLKAIIITPESYLDNLKFVLAGKFIEELKKDEFYSLLEEPKIKKHLVYVPGFCEDYIIKALIKDSLCILMPYKDAYQSSGLLGYASKYHCPVIGPSYGLIGKLIKRNRLGYGIKSNIPYEISECIKRISTEKLRRPSDMYILKNSKYAFCSTIVSCFNFN